MFVKNTTPIDGCQMSILVFGLSYLKLAFEPTCLLSLNCISSYELLQTILTNKYARWLGCHYDV